MGLSGETQIVIIISLDGSKQENLPRNLEYDPTLTWLFKTRSSDDKMA